MPLISIQELKRNARGKWESILLDLAPELSEAVDNAPHHVPCPKRGGMDGFRLWKDFHDTGGGASNQDGMFQDGFALLQWLKGYSFGEAVKEVSKSLSGDSVTFAPVKKIAYQEPDPVKAKLMIDKVLNRSRTFLPAENNPVSRYLAARGIIFKRLPKDLKFHPNHGYWDARSKTSLGEFPAMVFPVRNAKGEVVSVHRTYLSDTGDKAKVPKAKKLMPGCGTISGSAIRLTEVPGDELGFAEGVETALSVIKATGLPVWATVSARMLETVQIPEELKAQLKRIHIWADLDKSGAGLRSAEVLAKRLRLEGYEVFVHLPGLPIPPTEKGVDWLDVWNSVGVSGFPKEHIRQIYKKAA